MIRDDDDDSKNETDDKYGNIPPIWCFLVILGHVRMMSIGIISDSCALERSDNVSTPKQEAVRDQCADLGDN